MLAIVPIVNEDEPFAVNETRLVPEEPEVDALSSTYSLVARASSAAPDMS